MNARRAFAFTALLLIGAAVRAAEKPTGPPDADSDKPAVRPVEAPVLTGTNVLLDAAPVAHELVTFKGTLLLNEFIYRAVLQLPKGARATPETARRVRRDLANFLLDAGYVLAKVRAQVKGDRIEVQVDEGALDKIIFVGAGWITALRFRAALNLPLDVFNRRLFELQMPTLARKFGLHGYKFELWPVHLIETDNAVQLDDMEELRAMPLIRPARGYELRIFAVSEAWGTGFSPEVVLGGSIGYGVGGRWRWKDLIQDGDRWQIHLRGGGAFRSSLDPNGSTRVVNSEDFLSLRWLSKPWDGSSRGLRMTISPQASQWTLQRADLKLDSYRLLQAELGTGAGAQLSPELGLYFTLGLQRRWFFNVETVGGLPRGEQVDKVPGVANRAFLRLNTTYTFNPAELRQDVHNAVALELNAFRNIATESSGYVRFDLQGTRVFTFGWHELRLGGHLTGELGDVWFVDEIPLETHLRIGFGLVKYTERVGSLSLEFRYSLLRDRIKVGLYNDTGVWQKLPRDDPNQPPELAGSFGAGAFFFVLDELQIDAYYGAGWSTDSALRPGFALSIKEAF